MIQRWFGPSDAVPLSDQPDVEEATLPQPLESSLHTFQSPADAPMLRGVCESSAWSGRRWRLKKKLLKSSRHLHLLIVLWSKHQASEGLCWILPPDLPACQPSQVIQARQQVDGCFFLLVLKYHFTMVKTTPQPPFSIVSDSIVEKWDEIVLADAGRVWGGRWWWRFHCEVVVVIGLRSSGATMLRYQCQLVERPSCNRTKARRFQMHRSKRAITVLPLPVRAA